MNVLDDLLSGDRQRIWAASWEVIYSRDTALLLHLAEREPEIRTATRDVELGGMLRPNRAALDFAFQKLAFYAADHGCPCALYLSFDLYDPEREAREGNVVIIREDAGGYEYQCACTLCGSRYDVVREEYHYPWWRWTLEDRE